MHACQRITSLNERRKEGTLERMLRLSVEPGGCSGFSYKFEMADVSEVEDEDTCAALRDPTTVPRVLPSPEPEPEAQPQPQTLAFFHRGRAAPRAALLTLRACPRSACSRRRVPSSLWTRHRSHYSR